MIVVTSEFVSLATSLAKFYGYPELPMVIVPHPFNNLPEAEILRLADKHAHEIVASLVRHADPDLRTVGKRGPE